jgi:hypothetical protein
MTTDDIRNALLSGRQRYDATAPDQPGVYAIFLKPRGQLLPVTPGAGGLLYIGATHEGLAAGDHFMVASSGFSTLRRSLGAILRTHLWLQPCPRAPGPSESNTRNYAFAVDGEQILSRWMRANLLVSALPLPGDLLALESGLIALLEPPLNLTGWNNPQRPLIKRLRADCVRLAKDTARVAA